MAKKTQEEIDLEAMDFDGGFDTDFDFGDAKAKKPKTTREAVQSSLTDGAKGFKDEIVSDPAKTAKDLGYLYLPQEVVTKETYDEYVATLKDVNFTGTDGEFEVESQECAGGACPTK